MKDWKFLLNVHTGVLINVLKGFLWVHPPQLSAGDYFLHESRWHNRDSHICCALGNLWLCQLLLFEDNLFKAHLLSDRSRTSGSDKGGLCSMEQTLKLLEGIDGQTVSQEVIYLTEVFLQETSHHRKGKCWTRAPTPLTCCVQLLPPPQGAKKLLKMVRGFGDVLTRR